MIFDEAVIHIRGGNGGNGAATFRREKFVPLGGPDGGDGGRGGSVYIVANTDLNTLLPFRFKRQFAAKDGGKGTGRQRHGAAGEDLNIRVPVGTLVFSSDGVLLADLRTAGDSMVAARGGRGGLGNTHFTTSTNQAPRVAQKGEPGEELDLRLELRLIADVGLVGLPNAGKSTFLSAVTRARPKIADYPFTTLEPNLGVASLGDDFSMVLADIPGLIEGAHAGAGLGHEFLKHIMRTRVIIHIIDGSSEDPGHDFELVNQELSRFDETLVTKPQVVAVNKQDLPDARASWDDDRAYFEALGLPVYAVSAATGAGALDVLGKAAELLRLEKEKEKLTEAATGPVIRPEPVDEGIKVTVEDDGVYRVSGRLVERAVVMTDLENEDSLVFLQRTLAKMGVTRALEAHGVQPGDMVRFGKVELEWR